MNRAISQLEGKQIDLLSPLEVENLFRDPPFTTRSAEKARSCPVVSQGVSDQKLEEWRDFAINHPTKGENSGKTILSLFDESGVWSAPYVHAGYDVIQFDIQNGVDIMELTAETMFAASIDKIDFVLAACPCTHFANSGARWFEQKDADGLTAEGVALVYQTLGLIDFFQPEGWVIENPVGRIKRLCGLPEPRLTFQPHHYGDPYTKKTQLFGAFNPDLPICNVAPTEGSKVHKLRGDVPEQKKLRSLTPEGFAYAFFMANQI